MIPTKIHGILDYLVGLLLIAAPWLFQFTHSYAATIVALATGITTLCYSMITDYELSLLPLFSFRTHLVIDFLSGIFLIASPWLFGFSHEIRWPHLSVGILEILVVLLSRSPKRKRSST